MSVHKKLMQARIKLQQVKLKKSGLNKFAGFEYFELGDFLPTVQSIFAEIGLCGVVSYDKDLATLTITDIDDNSQIVITSPMAEANLKGVHPIQNMGAVETYSRRYLWVTALEIVEHDALDSTTGRKGDGPVIRPTQGEELSDDRMSVVLDVRAAIMDRMSQDDLIGAYEEYLGITDSEEKTVLWSQLDSKIRSAIKKHGESLKGQK